MNATLPASQNPTLLGTGLKTSLETVMRADENQRIQAIMIHNLTVNSPTVKTYTYTYTYTPLYPSKTITEKLQLLWVHINNHPNDYSALLGICLFFIALAKVTQIASRYIISSLDPLYNNILNKRLIYTAFGYSTGRFVEMDYYYNKLLDRSVPLAVCVGILALIATGIGIHLLLHLSASFENLSKDPCKLTLHEEMLPLTQTESEDFLPISNIKDEWTQAPRFLQVGGHLYTLQDFFANVLKNPLVNGLIIDPKTGFTLSKEDSDRLFKQLSYLFGLNETQIREYWDPYYSDPRKSEINIIRASQALPGEAQPAFIENILLEHDLQLRIDGYVYLDERIKANFREFVGPFLFLHKRITNFLRKLPVSVLRQELKNNESEKFTLESILNKSIDKLNLRLELR
jgi:hypothetical protein